jgi:hypothetical protein
VAIFYTTKKSCRKSPKRKGNNFFPESLGCFGLFLKRFQSLDGIGYDQFGRRPPGFSVENVCFEL